MNVEIRFDRGTLLIRFPRLFNKKIFSNFSKQLIWDENSGCYRSEAMLYREICTTLSKAGANFTPKIFQQNISLSPFRENELRDYQIRALSAWDINGKSGIVCLPTGAGKTRMAIKAISTVNQPTLCIVPTRILLNQWVIEIEKFYHGQCGILGDGIRNIQNLTVSTYESAYRNMYLLGNRFRFLIVDEAHHFGKGLRDEAILMSAAPWKLGLTATPPEEPDHLAKLTSLIGPVNYSQNIETLSGTYLAKFELIKIQVPLAPVEKRKYDLEAENFRNYLSSYKKFCSTFSWQLFVGHCSKSKKGRQAMMSFRRTRRMVSLTENKVKSVKEIFERHSGKKILLFTTDAISTIAVSKKFLIPAIIGATSKSERSEILSKFSDGTYSKIVSCKVLNEGMDVPDAEIAVILGGSSEKREHIQRIGRVLRYRDQKKAVIYEIIAKGTHEENHSKSRCFR